MPDSHIRLSFPQKNVNLTGNKPDRLNIKENTYFLSYNGYALAMPYDRSNNLPVLKTRPKIIT